ncbi:hypothetical protein B7494_g5666 [Chlorociboria aeruginascens]|nr:hypothetical protein B7494_g5666 [Chlorociboria aeruginascens]
MADTDLSILISRIPQRGTATPTPQARCCCGHTDCAYLKHNSNALDNLEQEVHTAAQLGQALLVRHEQYMVDAERERMEMSAKIEKLENAQKELEVENAKTVEENRELLDQLEGLNGSVTESESHVKSLEATLQSAHQEMRRLEALVSRTQDLEIQLANLEQEQEILQKTIATTEAEERSAIQRWKKAERRLFDLHEQLERIEREAREERERHLEVMGRMERQRVVERELGTAAGRLKGAAAAAAGNGKHGSSVVSHFVKDILQDNANLQLGIVELREMLMNSNDEVQILREQLLLHQPVEGGESNGAPTLRAELISKEPEKEPPLITQALHIHHHYHTPKKEEIRRPKKKRISLNTSLFTPPKSFTPTRPPRGPEMASTILSQTSVTVPTPITPNNRWSVQSGQMSDFAPSSAPSSPQSAFRNSALFDRGYDMDSSRPTSPGSSIDPLSPQFQPFRHRKKGSEVSTRSFVPPINFPPHNVIHEEENVDVEEIRDLETPSMPSLTDEQSQSDLDQLSENWIPPSFSHSLRRSTSHESILSVSGIGIHTLKSRPSQLTITGSGALIRPRTRLGSPSMLSVDTLTSSSMVTAQPTLSRIGHSSTSYLLSSIGHHPLSDNISINSSNSSNSNPNENSGISRKFGGWVFGRWGVSPAKSSRDLKASASVQLPQTRTVSSPIVSDPLKAYMGRPPGINQKGPVPGFRKSEKAPSRVTPDVVDHEALKESFLNG